MVQRGMDSRDLSQQLLNCLQVCTEYANAKRIG
jgi:hypothetical protein